ncbi:hypothetical protein [Mycobacteroides abscessus]|uniref:hypothetical protein n=1 Tax=Mycobacteroides abscessus TaxID=36809 RepID=UPI0013000D83|nr:hypothetical protein [Mycobacteroides abscessus]
MRDIVQDILDAAKLAKPWLWHPNHPQHVDGKLYLTAEQWNRVLEQRPPVRGDGVSPAFAAWGIPVVIIKAGDEVRLPSGKTLVYSEILESLVVFDQDEALQ